MMKKLWIVCCFAACALALNPAAVAQDQKAGGGAQPDKSITPNRVIGEALAVDPAATRLTIKADAGQTVNALLDEKTVFLRTQPGATDLTGATRITLAGIGVGDRVLALGRVAEDRKSIVARQIIVITKAALAERRARDREEWRRRGIAGVISALNPQAKEITLQLRSFGDAQALTIEASGKDVVFRRYAPDSVRFADAGPSSFTELKIGDQLRALGEKSAGGARFTPEEIVSGSFRTLIGQVAAVNAAANEIKITDRQTGKALTIVISKDTVLRRVPEEFTTMKPQSGYGGEKGGQGAAGGKSPEGKPGSVGQDNNNKNGKSGSFDPQRMLEWMPLVTLADLKPGESLTVSTVEGDDPTRFTAITVVAGLDAFLQMFPQKRSAFGASLGLPGGALDLGIGIP